MRGIVTYFNGERGLATLERVVAEGHHVTAAVIPERLKNSDVAQRAAATGVDVWPATDVNDPAFVEKVRAAAPRLGLIAGFSTIFKRPLIGVPALGTINLHAGPVPGYRGGSPLNWQIINGETRGGISVLRIDEDIDTGLVLAEAAFDIEATDTIADVHAKANRLFPDLVVRVLKAMEAGTQAETPQGNEGARYWRQRKPEDGRIDFEAMTASEIYNLVRALTRPYPGAFTEWQGHTLRLFATAPADGGGGTPGDVFDGAGCLAIHCRDGAVTVPDYELDGAGYQVQAFETELLGVPVGRLTWPDKGSNGGPGADVLDHLADGWRRQGVWLISCRIAEGAPDMALLEDTGFRPVETLVTFHHELDDIPDGGNVAPARPSDFDGCLAVAAHAFINDRLHRDPLVPDPVADRVREAWVRNNLTDRGDVTFVARDGDQVIGFNQCLLRGDQAAIDLIAVEPGQQGKGLGRALVAGALRHYRGRARGMIVGTQAENLPSTALYGGTGFKEMMRQKTLHWINPDVTPTQAGAP